MDYIKADALHLNAVTNLALLLWSEHKFEDLAQELKKIINSENSVVFICFDKTTEVAFAQFSLRFDYVEGTLATPVAYLEGIYVKEQYRNNGVAKRLIEMGEKWAKENKCSQMASDCELTNDDSLAFHLKCGFREVNRVICFVKDIKNI